MPGDTRIGGSTHVVVLPEIEITGDPNAEPGYVCDPDKDWVCDGVDDPPRPSWSPIEPEPGYLCDPDREMFCPGYILAEDGVDACAPGTARAAGLGQAIVDAARSRVTSDGQDYAYDRAPTSPLAGLSGNTHPGVTQPGWLQNNNKCNQFVGDSLTLAGVEAPTIPMDDGTIHYAPAEAWPARHDLFQRITKPADIQVGDVIVRDYPGSGDSTAHVEVVSGTNPLRTTGAHHDGAYESTSNWFGGTTYDSNSQSFGESSGNRLYILRPNRCGD